MMDPQERSLVQRAQGGDREAFARLCEQHRRRVWHTVASVARRRDDADDLAQDAIVKAFRSLPSYRGDAPFSAWLCRIALNTAHDHHKSAWKRKVLFWNQQPDGSSERPDEPDTTALPLDEATLYREQQRRVRAAVATLSERERNPIWLIYFEEYSLAEVARLESVPESTIRSRVKAGLRRLQTQLGDLAPGHDESDFSESEPGSPRPGTPLMKECIVR
jgi:RNA polymerase sigma-70 factor, ECF subfamily